LTAHNTGRDRAGQVTAIGLPIGAPLPADGSAMDGSDPDGKCGTNTVRAAQWSWQ
jgi:hypothetical protein